MFTCGSSPRMPTASRRPKFYVVTLLPPRTRGEAPEFQRPPDEVADKAGATAGR